MIVVQGALGALSTYLISLVQSLQPACILYPKLSVFPRHKVPFLLQLIMQSLFGGDADTFHRAATYKSIHSR